jgi:hypothetical protein
MRIHRKTEVNVLGYHLDRVEERDGAGRLRAQRYEVLCPHTEAVLAAFGGRREAERYIIERELAALRQPRFRFQLASATLATAA